MDRKKSGNYSIMLIIEEVRGSINIISFKKISKKLRKIQRGKEGNKKKGRIKREEKNTKVGEKRKTRKKGKRGKNAHETLRVTGTNK
ncbi:MAG: hypothetical protein PHV51_00290 [Methanosarcinaceae archaeon]|nr:hypothetical protein [Methanosarcinaceae archaeon]